MRRNSKQEDFTFTSGMHKGQKVLWCNFAYDKNRVQQFRQKYRHAKWSSSQKCWYLPDKPAMRQITGLNPALPTGGLKHNIHPVNLEALKKMEEMLLLKAYSPNTLKVYIHEFAQLLNVLKSKPVDELSPERLKAYLLYCITELRISENHLQSRLNAIKFYFEQVLGKQTFFFGIPRPKKPSKLPKVLSTKDISKLLEAPENIKHKLMLQLCYGMGLRVGEIVQIKITDVDSQRMQVFISNAKGKKDRVVVLPSSVLDNLRSYYKLYKPREYLFEGQYGGQYSIRSVQAVFKAALKKAGINKAVGIHSLRHSYATHLLEYGTDISYIQKLLGHKDIKTTLQYTHISDKERHKIQSPLDRLELMSYKKPK